MEGRPRWMSALLVSFLVLACLCAMAALPSAARTQSLSHIVIHSADPVASVDTHKDDDGNFEIHIHTNPSSDDGPVLPPKGDLDRWRNVKWWSDDFTKKYYKDSWDTISKAEKYRSSGGSEEMQLKLGGSVADYTPAKLDAIKASIAKKSGVPAALITNLKAKSWYNQAMHRAARAGKKASVGSESTTILAGGGGVVLTFDMPKSKSAALIKAVKDGKVTSLGGFAVDSKSISRVETPAELAADAAKKKAALRTRLLREINKANANLLAGVAGLKAGLEQKRSQNVTIVITNPPVTLP